MKEPDKVLQDLSDKSVGKLSTEQWFNYLIELKCEVDYWIRLTQKDLKSKTK